MENNGGTLINGWGTYEDGILTMNRSMGYHGTTCFAGQKFNLEANKTYTLSAIVYLTGTNATSNVILGFAGESNPNVTITKETWTKVSRTVTYTEYKENMRAFIQPSNTGNVLQIKEIMLCEGTDTNYSPYTDNPIELCKIGNYQDRIYYNSGKWYIEKQVGKVEIKQNGYIGVQEIISGANKFIWRYASALNVAGSGNRDSLLCNYFVGDTSIWGNNNKIGVYINGNNQTNFSMLCSTVGGTTSNTKAELLSMLETWLNNNKLIMYYPLATPTTTEITDTYLLEQLNGLLDIELYEDLCYVDWIGIEKPTMNLRYYVDTDKILERLREE